VSLFARRRPKTCLQRKAMYRKSLLLRSCEIAPAIHTRETGFSGALPASNNRLEKGDKMHHWCTHPSPSAVVFRYSFPRKGPKTGFVPENQGTK